MHIFGKNLHAGPNGPKCRKWEHYLGRLSTILTHSQGFLWHGGKHRQYTKPFRENGATTVGIFFDGVAGTLTYFKDGVSLGVAFDRLNEVHEPLYPIVCSTAAKTEMSLGVMKREFVSIQVNFGLS